jgi:hypothetical protein
MLVFNMVLLIHMLRLMFEENHTLLYIMHAQILIKKKLCACLKSLFFQNLKQSLSLIGLTYAIFLFMPMVKTQFF